MNVTRFFRKLVGGQYRGAIPAALRGVLRLLETPYTLAVSLRNALYDRGWLTIERLEAPVISVGNLTLGGTGKTPLVARLAEWAQSAGVRPGLISRGYGARFPYSFNDEAMELAWRLPGVRHLQDPDRATSGHLMLFLSPENRPEVLILDDAFQYRRVFRDLDIVLLDALEPFGFDHVFPRGTLREPLRSLARADAVLLSRADLVSPEERQAIRERVRTLAPSALWAEIRHAPESVVACQRESGGLTPPDASPTALFAGKSTESALLAGRRGANAPRSCAEFQRLPLETLSEFRDKPVVAACGIGNPGAFERTLAGCGLTVAETVVFPDHHLFKRRDLKTIAAAVKRHQAAAVFCTMKDFVKLRIPDIHGCPLMALPIGIEFLTGEDDFKERVTKCVSAPI